MSSGDVLICKDSSGLEGTFLVAGGDPLDVNSGQHAGCRLLLEVMRQPDGMSRYR